jgi:hypothetical protein
LWHYFPTCSSMRWTKFNWITLACLSFNLFSYNCSMIIYVFAKRI